MRTKTALSRFRTSGGLAVVAAVLTMLASLLVSCGSATSSSGGASTSEGPIKIGVLTDLTGANAENGLYEKRWTELLADRVNDAGGIEGRPIEIVVYDSALDPAKAARFARRLVEQDEVVAITCCPSSSEALQAAAVGAELKVPVLGGGIVGELTDEKEPWWGWYFRPIPGAEDTAQFNVDFGKERGWKSAAISHSNLTYGTEGETMLASLLEEAGIKAVRSVPIAADAAEASGAAATIARANPDGVLVWDYPNPTALIVKDLRQAGFDGDIVSNWSALNDSFWAVAGENVANMFAHDTFDPNNQHAQELVSAFRDRFGDEPWSQHQIQGAIFLETAMEGIRIAIRNGGEVTGETVQKALLEIDCLKTIAGPSDACVDFGRSYESPIGQNPNHGGSREMLVMKTVDAGDWALAD